MQDIYSYVMGNGYKLVSTLSCLFFVAMVIIAIHGDQMIHIFQLWFMGEFAISSLCVAAVIMILYNLFTWVEFTQSFRNGKQFHECENEMEKAKLLIGHLDEVCQVCSTIKNSIVQQEIEQRDGFNQQGLQAPVATIADWNEVDFDGHVITVIDQIHDMEYFQVKIVR